MSVELVAMTAPGREDEVPEHGWLELLAKFTTHPPPTPPFEPIARLLCRTFRGTACSYAGIVDDVVVGGVAWSDGGATALRALGTDPVGTVVMSIWDDQSPGAQLSLPAMVEPAERLAFVVGRVAPFHAAERRLAAALWTLVAALPALRPRPGSACLTTRELAVLGLLDEGLTAAAIARRLQISVRTVHKHLERIYAKLEVPDRLSAVLAARRIGVVPQRPVEGEQCKI